MFSNVTKGRIRKVHASSRGYPLGDIISRICEHKRISPRTSMPFSNPPFSNIREHALSYDHPIKVDNFSVLARCPSHDLRLLESIFIHKFSPNLNNQASSFPLQILS